MFWDFTLTQATYNTCLNSSQEGKTSVDDEVKEVVGFTTGDPNPHGLVHVVDSGKNHVITISIPEKTTEV